MNDDGDIQELYGRVMFCELFLRTLYLEMRRGNQVAIPYTLELKKKFVERLKKVEQELTTNTPEAAEAIVAESVRAAENWFDGVLIDLGHSNDSLPRGGGKNH